MENQDQALLLAIMQTAVDAIIVINADGIIQSTNPATTRLFGYEKREMVGQNVKMLMPPPFQEQHDGYLSNYAETGRAKIIGIGREVMGKRKDDSVFPMHLAVSHLVVADKQLFAGIVRDITDLKKAQSDLAAANALLEKRVQERTMELREAQADLIKSERLATLGQVSGGIAHEIRNPLNAVRTSVYYLRHAKNPSQEKIDEHLERIDRQVSLIDNVVTALSDIARLPDPTLGECDLNDLIDNVLSTVPLPGNIELLNELPRPPLCVTGDPNQISIVFRNLIRNARDAMPSGGTLTISATASENVVVVNVRDTGTGIPSDQLARITEPLYSTKARGMGLGLAISVAILKKNRGRLEVSSLPGQGATFSVHLNPFDGGQAE
ncbi:MAG: PAS domain S-box protein [Planctomycetales bacterium]|nr:PAS domain S-box protein [Planctomycetales bacterium]